MEARFKRDYNHNYMILSVQEKDNYRIKMICNNKIKGLLESHISSFNGSYELYYDVSSKQPLSRLYARKEMGIEEVVEVLSSVKILMEELRKYLLDSDSIIFHPDFCYCNPETLKAEWTCYPGENQTWHIRELAEFLIDRVNHSDCDAVELAYGFYKMVKADCFGIKEMDELLQKYGREREFEQPEKEEIKEENPYDDWGHEEEKQPERLTLFEKIKKLIMNRPEKEARIVPFTSKVQRYESSPGREMFDEEYPKEYTGETMVMGVQSRKSFRRLRSIKKGSVEYISLDKLPCILGKMEECADVVLKDISVSRMHAKIFEENGELFLQDLNSKNGSYVNNLELDSNEIVKLSIGDEIAFGNLRYIYE